MLSGCAGKVAFTSCKVNVHLVQNIIVPKKPATGSAKVPNERLAKDFVTLQTRVMEDNKRKDELRKQMATCVSK